MVNTNRSLFWKKTDNKDKPPHSSWSEDGYIKIRNNSTFDKFLSDETIEEVVYILHEDERDNNIYLNDLRNDVLYNLGRSNKSKGYILGFKLNLKR